MLMNILDVTEHIKWVMGKVVDRNGDFIVSYNAGKHQQQKESRMSERAEIVEKLKAKGASNAVVIAAKAKLGR